MQSHCSPPRALSAPASLHEEAQAEEDKPARKGGGGGQNAELVEKIICTPTAHTYA